MQLHHRVVFGETLKLSSSLDDPDALYRLKCVVVHVGTTAGSGHYVAVVAVEGQWILFNDEQARVLDASQLSSFFGGSLGAAYMLFYERDSAATPESDSGSDDAGDSNSEKNVNDQ